MVKYNLLRIDMTSHFNETEKRTVYRPISQTVFMLSIAINRAERVCATVIIKHNYMLLSQYEGKHNNNNCAIIRSS